MIKLTGLGLAIVLNYAFLLAPVSYSAEPNPFRTVQTAPKWLSYPPADSTWEHLIPLLNLKALKQNEQSANDPFIRYGSN